MSDVILVDSNTHIYIYIYTYTYIYIYTFLSFFVFIRILLNSRLMEQINGFFVYESHAMQLVNPDAIGRRNMDGSKKHKRIFSTDGPNLLRIMSNDRPELSGSFKPLIKRMTTVDSSKEVVVIIDPYSTGTCVADETMKRGFSVIALWSKGISEELKKHVPLSCSNMQKYFASMDVQDDLASTSEALYKAAGMKKIVACFAGGETGTLYEDGILF
jgi:hypothetical protein